MTTNTVLLNDQCNPLDSAEEFLDSQNWTFDRLSDEQLYLSIEGERGTYKMFFMWDELQNALQFCCEIDLCMIKERLPEAYKMLADVNSTLWLGHFDLSPDEKSGCFAPCFRYTSLVRGMQHSDCLRFIQDLIQITLQECERLHDAFYVLDKKNDISVMESTINSVESMKLALAEAVGHC